MITPVLEAERSVRAGPLIWGLRIGWPAFMAACVLELLVFAMVDPQELHWLGAALPGSRQTVYSLAFFVFWLVCAGAGSLTALLAQPERLVDRPERD